MIILNRNQSQVGPSSLSSRRLHELPVIATPPINFLRACYAYIDVVPNICLKNAIAILQTYYINIFPFFIMYRVAVWLIIMAAIVTLLEPSLHNQTSALER